VNNLCALKNTAARHAPLSICAPVNIIAGGGVHRYCHVNLGVIYAATIKLSKLDAPSNGVGR
jgi:hypothetical protein